MEKFITASESSKNAHNMMTVSSTLPVNILVFGEEGIGKKKLVQSTFPELSSFYGDELEKMYREKRIDFSNDEGILVFDIDQAGNVTQLIEHLEEENLKIIATAKEEKDIFNDKFLVKVQVAPLIERPEDTKILTDCYIEEAKELFKINDEIDSDMVEINLENNSISLKESIYRSLLLNSIDREQIMPILEQFLLKEIEEKTDYKELLEIFEIPLLKAMRKKFKSQLQMASKLGINRNTLRKKMYQYGLEEK